MSAYIKYRSQFLKTPIDKNEDFVVGLHFLYIETAWQKKKKKKERKKETDDWHDWNKYHIKIKWMK